jgi:hypothetical protein
LSFATGYTPVQSPSESQLSYTRKNFVSGRLLARAIEISLPKRKGTIFNYDDESNFS